MKFKKNTNYNVRKIHRYLGVFMGVQFFFWSLGGLYFSWNNMDDVHGETLLKQEKKYVGSIDFSQIQTRFVSIFGLIFLFPPQFLKRLSFFLALFFFDSMFWIYNLIFNFEKNSEGAMIFVSVIIALMELYDIDEYDFIKLWRDELTIQHPLNRKI